MLSWATGGHVGEQDVLRLRRGNKCVRGPDALGPGSEVDDAAAPEHRPLDVLVSMACCGIADCDGTAVSPEGEAVIGRALVRRYRLVALSLLRVVLLHDIPHLFFVLI